MQSICFLLKLRKLKYWFNLHKEQEIFEKYWFLWCIFVLWLQHVLILSSSYCNRCDILVYDIDLLIKTKFLLLIKVDKESACVFLWRDNSKLIKLLFFHCFIHFSLLTLLGLYVCGKYANYVCNKNKFS